MPKTRASGSVAATVERSSDIELVPTPAHLKHARAAPASRKGKNKDESEVPEPADSSSDGEEKAKTPKRARRSGPPVAPASTSATRAASQRKAGANGDIVTKAESSDDEPSKTSIKKSKGKQKQERQQAKPTSSTEPLTDLEELAKGNEDGEDVDSKEQGKGKGKGKAKVGRRKKKYKGLALEHYNYPARYLDSKKFIGAHVSISESVAFTPHRALHLGAKAFGLFTKNQKTWTGKPLHEESIRLFKLRCSGQTETIPDEEQAFDTVVHGDGKGFDPKRHIVPHGSYLTNLCNPDKEKRKKSYENFLDELKRAEALGIGLFNIHPGSTVGGCTREESYAYIAECINDAHEDTEGVCVLLENMAGKNNVIGYKLEDLAAIIALIKDKTRIGVCFDTCHGFAAGYDLRTPEVYAETWKQFDEIVGLQYLKAFHVNDSKEGLGAHRDLHENIGAGELGLSAFHNLMRDTRFDGLPFILETPMLSGSLQVTVKMPSTSPAKTPNAHTPQDGVKVETEDVKLFDSEAANKIDEEAVLTISASTWKREIHLLHALEQVPVGETSETIERLSAEIMALVLEVRELREKEKQKKKQEKDLLKAAKGDAESASPTKSSNKGKRAPKVEDEEEEDEMDELAGDDESG